MYMRLVHLWGARAKHAVTMRMPISTLPRRATYFSDGIAPGYRSWPPLWPRGAVLALVKTRNQFHRKDTPHDRVCYRDHRPRLSTTCREA